MALYLENLRKAQINGQHKGLFGVFLKEANAFKWLLSMVSNKKGKISKVVTPQNFEKPLNVYI